MTLYVGQGELILDTATGVETGRRYYDGVGTRTKADGLTYVSADHHGTAEVAVQATSPASMDVRRLDLFGNPRAGSPTWRGGPLGFVNGTTNASTGLTRLGAREYDPALGRFISVDPVIDHSDPQQMNGYAYANNNPVSMSDPDGLKHFVDADGRYSVPGAAANKTLGSKRYWGIVRRVSRQASRYYPKWPDTSVPYPDTGMPLPKKVIDHTLRPQGYTGSDRFTYRDAFRFAAQGPMQWAISCQILGGSTEDCKSENAPWEFIKAAGWEREWSLALCGSGSFMGAGIEGCVGVDRHGVGYTGGVTGTFDGDMGNFVKQRVTGGVGEMPGGASASVKVANQSFGEQGGEEFGGTLAGVNFSKSTEGNGKSVSIPVGPFAYKGWADWARGSFAATYGQTVKAGYLANWDTDAPGFANNLANGAACEMGYAGDWSC